MSTDYLSRYTAVAPLSFALCRALECRLLARAPIEAPILDLGCGDGLFARILFGDTRVAVGIDVSGSEARRARANGSYREVVLTSGADLPFASGTFRTVLSNSVLEHIPDLAATLSECYRVLEPGGKMVVTVPHVRISECFFYSNTLRRLGLRKAAESYVNWKLGVWKHYNMSDEEGWSAAIEKVGFRVDEVRLFNSRATSEVADLLFPLGPPSLLIKKLSGRMVLRPAIWSRLLSRGLRKAYEQDNPVEGPAGAVYLVASKAL